MDEPGDDADESGGKVGEPGGDVDGTGDVLAGRMAVPTITARTKATELARKVGGGGARHRPRRRILSLPNLYGSTPHTPREVHTLQHWPRY